MENIGYLLLLLMGMTLGMVGAGGSILTIPILVYVFKIPVILATTYSLFVVGATAFIGVIRHKNNISVNQALIFSVPSAISIFLMRFYIMPVLPKTLGPLSTDTLVMMLLVAMMFFAAYFMIKNPAKKSPQAKVSLPKVVFIAFIAGIIMGLLGAGGGFLIVPTLILFLGLEIKPAVATSLFIILLNSLVGFLSDQYPIGLEDYKNLFLFTGLAWIGMGLGLYLSAKIPSAYLKKGFGWFIASVATAMSVKELYF